MAEKGDRIFVGIYASSRTLKSICSRNYEKNIYVTSTTLSVTLIGPTQIWAKLSAIAKNTLCINSRLQRPQTYFQPQ
jgi:hypothetical protein